MVDEITLGDSNYVSSRRAAEIAGYTRDYVGQLARKGLIDAQRVGGLWYIREDSILKHKNAAEAYEPEAPERPTEAKVSSSLISFDGREYISSKRGAEITGYAQDYIGQLARSGKIMSRQIAGRWYVAKEELIQHKKHNDALLAAVQAEAVGLGKTQREIREHEQESVQIEVESSERKTTIPVEPINYIASSGYSLPPLERKEEEKTEAEIPDTAKEYEIPVRVLSEREEQRLRREMVAELPRVSAYKAPQRAQVVETPSYAFGIFATTLAVIAAVAGGGIVATLQGPHQEYLRVGAHALMAVSGQEMEYDTRKSRTTFIISPQ